ncbi:MAG TPA: phosphoglycolate phosphatase [Usitatibacter sp.]|nr:phosphoglycolate phosphatase [Usitatibacter sp.]
MKALGIRAVIFDLDGTLVDSAGEIATALNRTLQELGRGSMARAEVESLIGKGVRSLVERALARNGGASERLDAIVERFEAHYAQTVATQSVLFKGVQPGLTLLKEHGVPMGVVTNKPRFFTELLLEQLGVTRFFGSVVAGDDGFTRKPAGDMLVAAARQLACEPAATLMIGDSDNDVLAARNAGCPVWCVPYGYNEGRAPEALDCDRLVPDIEAAARLLVP